MGGMGVGGGWCTPALMGATRLTGDLSVLRTLKIVKKDEFSTKCNQTDHHRMSGGRQEVSPRPCCPGSDVRVDAGRRPRPGSHLMVWMCVPG